MRRTLIRFACLLASLPIAVLAQTVAAPEASKQSPAVFWATGPMPLSLSCPADLQIHPGASAGLVAVKRAPGTQNPGMSPSGAVARFHFTTTDKRVSSMQITAHGFGTRTRLLSLADSVHSTLATQLGVSFHPSSDGTPYGEITLHHFAGVTSIDVERVEYADGTSWQAGPGETCTVIPDGFMPVNSR